jgi:hypothetical protein
MAAPEYVPRPMAEKARVYESPPWRFDPWVAGRPSDLGEGQPIGPRLGYPGPDQGFMLKLARGFEGKLTLTEGEHEADVIAGAVAIALRRASMFGRAPVVHDLTVALTAFGFLGDSEPDAELVALRRELFDGVAHGHNYVDLHTVVDSVPEASLRLSPKEVRSRARDGWRQLLDVER